MGSCCSSRWDWRGPGSGSGTSGSPSATWRSRATSIWSASSSRRSSPPRPGRGWRGSWIRASTSADVGPRHTIHPAPLMRYEWPASYLDGQTAARHPVSVRLMREGLEVTTPGGLSQRWGYDEIHQTQGFYEGEEGRLERGGELAEALLIADPGF